MVPTELNYVIDQLKTAVATLAQIADATGIAPRTLDYLKAGETDPRYSTIAKLIGYFDK